MWASALPQRMRRASRNPCFRHQRSVAGRATGAESPSRAACDMILIPRKVLELSQAVARAHGDFSDLARIILETPSIQNRFETAGILKLEAARDLAVVGVVARASGIDIDVRRDHPYGALRTLFLRSSCHALRGRDGARKDSDRGGGDIRMVDPGSREIIAGRQRVCSRPRSRRDAGLFRRGIPPRRTLLLDGSARWQACPVSHQVAIVSELARDAFCGGGQHHRGFPADQ